MKQTVFTTTLTLPYFVSYTCSKCKKKNHFEKTIELSGNATAMGHLFTDRAKAGYYSTASDRASKDLQKRITAMQNGDYSRAEYDCKCKFCGNIEPWSKMHFFWLDKLLPRLLIIPIAANIPLLVKDYPLVRETLIFDGVVALLFILWFMYKAIKSSILNKKIASLPKSSLPRFSFEKEEIFDDSFDEEIENTNAPISKEESEFIHNAIADGKTFEYARYEYKRLHSSQSFSPEKDSTMILDVSDDVSQNHSESIKYNNPSILLVSDELTKLKQLLDAGILTKEEFTEQKAKLLGRKQ